MKKNGFTLIELLAVIIILGVLMIIAVPAVTKYINDSRKNGYVSTAKSLVNGAMNLIHGSKLELLDEDTTYYIDGKCIKTDSAYKSPYGNFNKAYVVITIDNDTHNYYWTSIDETGTGVKGLINIDKLDDSYIENNLNESDITTNRGIDERSKIVIVEGPLCSKSDPYDALIDVNSSTGKKNVLCQKAKTLHTSICERTTSGCANVSGIGSGGVITYGTIPGQTLKPGAAFNCDVNKDNIFDSETERFYYITNDGTNASLIYYKNINDNELYAYDSSGINNRGPRTAYQYLPSASVWSNPKIIAPGTRSIVTESESTSTTVGDIESFTYEGKVARFITYKEIQIACNKTDIQVSKSLDRCNWLVENLGMYESDSGVSGYWLETPISTNSNYATATYAQYRSIVESNVMINSLYGVRPVITVNIEELEQ